VRIKLGSATFKFAPHVGRFILGAEIRKGEIMEEVNFAAGVRVALQSLLTDRLTILAGAGLSMAPPTLLPSAPAVAAKAKQKYTATYGALASPLPDGIEDQAEHFFAKGELASVYFRFLVDKHAFTGPPNAGHFAIADLLLVSGIKTAVTTNVDTVIENAGAQLYGKIAVGVDGVQAAALHPDDAPLLKIHGCQVIDPDNMVWAPSQLAASPVRERVESSAEWLRGRLVDRDLLIVGYWTDWDYLNRVLGDVLGTVRPSKVLVVDPADGAEFEKKAPELYALGQRAQSSFQHVQTSGSDFLDALRREFSRSFIRRTLHAGAEVYEEETGAPPPPAFLEPPAAENDILWRVRRDIEGIAPNSPCQARVPPDESLLGLTLLKILRQGGVFEGPFWLLGGKRIRVMRAPNRPLHKVAAAHDREFPPAVAPDLMIAVGAEATGLPANIVREGTLASVARGTPGRWLTRRDAEEELGL
jgi:hypothetical protein